MKLIKHMAGFLLAFIIAVSLPLFSQAAEKTDSVVEELTIDDHRYPAILLEIFGQRVIDETCKTIDAFMAGESSVTFDEYVSGDIPDVQRCINIMCPLFSGFAYVSYDCMDDKAGRFYWTNCCTVQELAGYKAALEESVTAFLDTMVSSDSDLLKAIDLYYRYVSVITYDWQAFDSEVYESESTAEKAYRGSTYAALVDHTAICYGLSDGLAYLYTQAGLNSVPVGSDVSELGNGAHAWLMLQIDGKYYYADPTWDMKNENGYAGLHYFGMSEQDRYDAGGYTFASTQLFGNVWKKDISVYGLEDQRFSMLRDECFSEVESVDLDHEQQRVVIRTSDGKEHVITAE